MNSAVPSAATPTPSADVTRRARPKSMSLTSRRRLLTITTLSGCTLRWTMPRWCKYWSASSTCHETDMTGLAEMRKYGTCKLEEPMSNLAHDVRHLLLVVLALERKCSHHVFTVEFFQNQNNNLTARMRYTCTGYVYLQHQSLNRCLFAPGRARTPRASWRCSVAGST